MKLNKKEIHNLYIPATHADELSRFCEEITTIEPGIEGIVLIGSATRPGEFLPKKSDLDLCIYDDNILSRQLLLEQIMKELSLKGYDIIMPPKYVCDYSGCRIESFLGINGINIDITWIPTDRPYLGESFFDIPQDNFEIHIANIFVHGKLLYGVIPNREYVEKNYLPYYSNSVINQRTRILSERIMSKNRALKKDIKNGSKDIAYSVNKIRGLLLQYLFIKGRIYPASYGKRLHKQLDSLNLSSDAKNAILLLGEGDMYNLARKLTVQIDALLEG